MSQSRPESKPESKPKSRAELQQSPEDAVSLPVEPLNPDISARLRSLTPARVGLRRSGSSIATSELLDFQLSHARARDAVHAPLQPSTLLPALSAMLKSSQYPSTEILVLHSAAKDRQTYLQRPDLGRKLDEPSQKRLHERPQCPCDLAILIADGLSALAVERNAVALISALLPLLSASLPELRIAPISLVEQARVAIGDEIAHGLHANLAIVLIGERPGLSSPDSLGAYITWQPRPGITSDAERNCISNIRAEGLSYPQAAARLLHYIQEARSKRLTGVALKDPDTDSGRLELSTGTALEAKDR
jgi:ethanolamine ammonia-lyase small subunit